MGPSNNKFIIAIVGGGNKDYQILQKRDERKDRNDLGVIMKAIPFCTIITDRKNPFRSGSGSFQSGTWELDDRINPFCMSDKYIYVNEDNDKCWSGTISEALHFLSDSGHLWFGERILQECVGLVGIVSYRVTCNRKSDTLKHLLPINEHLQNSI